MFASFLVLALAAPAAAEVRPMRLVIRDADGKLIGPAQVDSSGELVTLIRIDGLDSEVPLFLTRLHLDLPHGGWGGGWIVFATADCSSTGYVRGFLRGTFLGDTSAWFVGNRLFTAPSSTPTVSVNVQSLLTATGCEPWTPPGPLGNLVPTTESALGLALPLRLEAVAGGHLAYTTMPPCRLLDTREVGAQTTGQPLTNPGPHPFRVQGNCGVPGGARAVTVNLTVIEPTQAGDARLNPADELPSAAPTSNLNFSAGVTLANATVAHLGAVTGAQDPDLELRIAMMQAGTAHFTIDVTGWFE